MAGPTKAELEEKIAQLELERDGLIAGRMRAENDLIDFKQKVRHVAVEVAQEQGWCLEGLNTRLAELNLEQVPVRAKVTTLVEVTWDVDLSDDGDVDHNDVKDYLEGQFSNFEGSVPTWTGGAWQATDHDLKQITVTPLDD